MKGIPHGRYANGLSGFLKQWTFDGMAGNGNKSKTARMLGISRKAFYTRLSECLPE